MSTNRTKFSFTGEVYIPRDSERFFKKWQKEGQGGLNTMASLDFGVRENSHNMGFVRLFGMGNKPIRTMSAENKPLEIAWADRLKPECTKEVARYRKHYINLGDELGGAQEFISSYDAIEFLAEVLPNYQGKVRVTGEWRKDAYDGKITDRFIIQNITAVADNEPSKLQITMDLFYNGDCIDSSSFKEDGKIFVNGYVKQYINKDTGEKYFPQSAILCNAAYDMTNDQHVKMWELKKKYVEGLSKKKMFHMNWSCRYINGAEEVEFDESMLTDEQREAIAVGLATVDDYKPVGNTYGDRVLEIRLAMPIIKGEFANGIVEADDTLSEFDDNIFRFAKEEKLNDVIKEETAEISEFEEEESLF